jgi:Methyltransferase domain
VLGSPLATALGAVRELAAVPRERRRAVSRPPPDGLVVEVGGGQRAHPRADVVIDKYVVDDFEREAGLGLDLSRPLVVADGERLPLRDGAAAFVIALHVLEHAPDPAAFAAELSRVAPAGFVQVPSRLAELTYGWPFHPWLIDLVDGELVFEPRDGRSAPAGDLFHDDLARSALHRLWFAAHRSRWHLSVAWQGELRVRAPGRIEHGERASFDAEATAAALGRLDGEGRLQPLPEGVRDALCCPACRAPLAFEPRLAGCESCGRAYPVAGPVPLLLDEAAER